MTDLTRLTVSLTKHGAHKIALLLREFDGDTLLDHLVGSVPNVNIERAQALRNLSANSRGEVPAFWNQVRSMGNDAINGLVFLAIIFSHHALMEAMRSAEDKSPFQGTIRRNQQLAGKAYTNFAHTVHELGYSAENFYGDYIRFDLQKLFKIEGLNKLVEELWIAKLREAGWSRNNSLLEEIERLKLHEVLSMESEQLRNWMISGSLEAPDLAPKDAEFFSSDAGQSGIPFTFNAGHSPKKTGKVSMSPGAALGWAELIHNDIQNRLYAALVAEYGLENVQTEAPTGGGTLIDIVVRRGDSWWFYEIKTASTVRVCIRQALPQLLEYAYWKKIEGVEKLIVVSPLPATPESVKYLDFLKSAFGLPLEYMQFPQIPH